ncbi:MAG: magnesium-translocating P-type ATPase [Erysipelotrichaceae bacterium]|nr:magnesium-translocating P-type ATPase [Erysipelotrichaceae bacterium]MDY5251252.1 magnesium-translocating P-type ATPase [Erysipelotrichaceae bacterium]
MKDHHQQAYYAQLARMDHQQLRPFLAKQAKDNPQIANKPHKYKWLWNSWQQAFFNPFTSCLLVLSVVSYIATHNLAHESSINNYLPLILFITVLISGFIRLFQEYQAYKALLNLKDVKQDRYKLITKDGHRTIYGHQLQVGDIISLDPGDKVPADIILLEAHDLFISNSALNGESSIEPKHSDPIDPAHYDNVLNYPNMLFKGSIIILGQAKGIIVALEEDTLYGSFALEPSQQRNNFTKGANHIALILIRFMIILIIIVFGLNAIIHHDHIQAFFFAISIGIGLIPEMLPLVIASCLSHGTHHMRKQNTIIRNINSMQDLGSMDLLCTDKTGTLTNDRLTLEYYMDILGNESMQVLDYAFLNSHFQLGVANPIDTAIQECQKAPSTSQHFDSLLLNYQFIDAHPFDHQRKFSTITVLNHENHQKMMIAKGDIQAILERCDQLAYANNLYPLDKQSHQSVDILLKDMFDVGMKVIAIAYKNLHNADDLSEDNFTLLGFIAFFDAPKQSAQAALAQLHQLKIKTKILTGDRLDVALAIAKRLGFDDPKVLSGSQLATLDEQNINIIIENIDIFAEMSPAQKAQVIALLQENGHTVGYLGDGINDIPALAKADVGISVENATSNAKDIADIILLEKDLNILGQAILEGRKTFIKMNNYIKITASSNFGNILSIVIASIFLPFAPMSPAQILLLNLFYDCLCIVLIWDNVDSEIYQQPQKWSGKTLSRFMLTFGSISSLFDIITFIILYLIIVPSYMNGQAFASLNDLASQQHFIMIFQTGWFLMSMWTQTMIIQLLRTKKLPFIQSKPSKPMLCGMLLGIIIFSLIPYSFLASTFHLSAIPISYYLYLIIIVFSYLLLTSFIKIRYLKKYHDLN